MIEEVQAAIQRREQLAHLGASVLEILAGWDGQSETHTIRYARLDSLRAEMLTAARSLGLLPAQSVQSDTPQA